MPWQLLNGSNTLQVMNMKNLSGKRHTNENLFIDSERKPRDIKSPKDITDKSCLGDILFINIERKPIDSKSCDKDGKRLHCWIVAIKNLLCLKYI